MSKFTHSAAIRLLIYECRYIQEKKDRKGKSNYLRLFDDYAIKYFKQDFEKCALEIIKKIDNSKSDDNYVQLLEKKYPNDTIDDAFFIDAAHNLTQNKIEQLLNWLAN